MNKDEDCIRFYRDAVTAFKQFELAANNLKTATKKVDDSTARVEVALKTLVAA